MHVMVYTVRNVQWTSGSKFLPTLVMLLSDLRLNCNNRILIWLMCQASTLRIHVSARSAGSRHEIKGSQEQADLEVYKQGKLVMHCRLSLEHE